MRENIHTLVIGSPAERFSCIPHCSGVDGGHDIDLRQFARRGIRLYGGLDAASGKTVRFTSDLAERLAFADAWFGKLFQPMFDAYNDAAKIGAPPDDRPPPDPFVPPTVTELDLAAAASAASYGPRAIGSTSAG